MDQPLISIIMPAYNAEKYIAEAIESVIKQSYSNWELIIVNDGSIDQTANCVQKFKDRRIRYFDQGNRGASAARNIALSVMQGDFFCFLDADDVLPESSLLARLVVFEKDPEIFFVDGKVEILSQDLTKIDRIYLPSFRGFPIKKLAMASSDCFFGLSWMIKRIPSASYSMKQGLTHGEDLLFYLSIAHHGKYDFTAETIYMYRKVQNSAMTNLEGLENGYFQLYKEIKKNNWANKKGLFLLRLRIVKIMGLSYFKLGNFGNSLKAVFRFMIIR